MGGGKLPLAPSLPSATARKSEHLGEVPALDEVSGQVPGGWAMDNHPNIPPWHPGCGLPVNEIWGSKESEERGQGWSLGDVWGGEEEELIKGKAILFLTQLITFSVPAPTFAPAPSSYGLWRRGHSPSKGRSSCTQSLVIRLL